MTRGEVGPYRDLANAIIIQAAKDYRRFRRRLEKRPDDSNAIWNIKNLEGFFLSPWCDFLAGELDGAYILEKLRKEEDG